MLCKPDRDVDELATETRMNLRMNPVTLAFERALEAAYRRDTAAQNLRKTRVALVVAGALVGAFGAWDAYRIPDALGVALTIRFGVVLPLLALVLGLSFLERLKAHIGKLVVLAVLVVGVGLVALMLAAPPPPKQTGPMGLILFTMFVYLATRMRFVAAAGASWTVLAVYAATALGVAPAHAPIFRENAVFLVAANLIGMFACYLMESFMRTAFLREWQLAHESEKVERLLRNILPAAIAQRLKRGEVAPADRIPEATVVFADIVDFTAITSALPPERVVEHLNAMFSAFDDLADRFGLEKIKTIGDAYMAVAGVPVRRDDGAEAAAHMALSMLREVERLASDGRGLGFRIRIGIHTGPVVAGVIGRRKFAYDLWGDTVNTASRLEASGVPGQIHVSQATFEKLRAAFDLVPRGPIELKGKGALDTYLLVGPIGARGPTRAAG
jgi:class 3 adenylate cyclase